ncbi:MAG TPA: hypothetical protein VFZ09_37070 [Archangium sp.]|uniref:hypothetical protein n=1 Tax=Archangium sp. TaxID=1872627 RepID=UPI002E2F9D7C|nr:hypothetical protein [Archangium sp.]HEX5751892.1 hypothetical protein [Archangium sp.]
MAPARPSQEDEEDLAAFELPFFQRLVVQRWAMVLALTGGVKAPRGNCPEPRSDNPSGRPP